MTKVTDDYAGKRKLWARASRPVPLPCAEGWPAFGHRKFDSYEAMNAWKKELIREAMRRGGVRWKSC